MPATPASLRLRFEPIVDVDEALWRQRVMDQLQAAAPASARLTLLSAPAGFGKTTVLAQLAAQARSNGAQVAWLNCDERDKDPEMFADDLAAALACCGLTRDAARPVLVEQLAALGVPLLVCIDDFERASGPEVDGIVEQLARVAPVHLRIVLASRELPHHQLTRLQLAGKLRLMDAELLRFNHDEAMSLLAGVLSARDAAQMVDYADGWPFALQLARLRADGAAMPPALGREAIKVPRRQIFDYLANEVLATLPAPLLEFLSEVAVLERVDVAAANAVREREDSLALIRQLTRIRPVVIVNEQDWSARLHPLLRDYLIDALELASPDRASTLHLRAARYLAERGELHEAVAHAVAGGRLDLGAQLIEDAGAFRLVATEGAVRLRLMLEQLPDAVIRRRPRLRLIQMMQSALEGGSHGLMVEFERLEQQIREADTPPQDPARFDLEIVRCTMQIQASAQHLRFSPWSTLDQGIQLARSHGAEDERLLACTLPIEIYFLHRYGPIERCERRVRAMEAVFAHGAYGGNSPWISLYRARTALAQGELAKADRHIRHSLQQDANFLNFRQGSLNQLVLVLLGRLAYLRGELAAAREHFGSVPAPPIRLLEVMQGSQIESACCEFALGHVEQAMAQLDETRQLAFEENLPQLEALAGATQVEFFGRLGDLAGMQAMAERIRLEELWQLAQEPFALPWVLVEAIARAAFLLRLQRGEAQQAADVGNNLLPLAKGSGHRLSELSAALMLARATQNEAALVQALEICEATGAVQVFIDAGAELIAQVRGWLQHQTEGSTAPAVRCARQLLQVWEQRFRARAQGAVADLLTPREVDVLCELAKDHATKLIAKNLLLSPETVKHHLKAIFAKLEVRSREDAVAEARRRALMP
jgi:ATP/maltotriose-dependent transcriptional regulator MalT